MTEDSGERTRSGPNRQVREGGAPVVAPSLFSLPAQLLDRAVRGLVTLALIAAGLSIVGIVLIGIADTAGRAFFNAPFLGAVEITEALMASAIFLALASAQQRGEHVAVDLVAQHYGPQLKRIMHFVILIATFCVFAFLAWRSFEMAQHSWAIREVSPGYLPVPIYISKAAATFGLFVALAETLRELAWLVLGRDVQGELRAEIHRNAEAAALE